MVTISKTKVFDIRNSIQLKFAASYVVLIGLLLLLMNTYPISMSQNLAFTSKMKTMEDQAGVISASLSELGTLSADEVSKAMSSLEDMNLTRIIITDTDAKILFDTSETEKNAGKYAVFSEISKALNGMDVFYSVLKNNTFMSRVAMPVQYKGTTIGSVYLYDYETEQATLISNIQKNMMRISYIVLGASILLALVFSRAVTKRINSILSAIKVVREGSYDYKLAVKGRDELTQLGNEFNLMADRLKTTDEMRRRFVSDASHELKTPLAAIKLLSDSIVQNECMDVETTRDFVKDIGREADRLVKITEDLLSISRLEGKKETKPCAVDMKNVVLKALSILTVLARNGEINIQFELQDGCFVLAVEDDLHQIVFNLVENAIKYNEPGGQVYVYLRKSDDKVVFITEDTGVGIPQEDMPFIFDRFYRVDKARSREAGGSGLGLSIVSDAAKRYGGMVEVFSREGGGSRFVTIFPLCKGGLSL